MEKFRRKKHLKGTFRVYDPKPSRLSALKNRILRGDPHCEAERDETLVLGFCDMVAAGMNNVANVGVPQAVGRNGVAVNVQPAATCDPDQPLGLGGYGEYRNGITLGSGAPTPVAIASFALDTPIIHGNGAGNLVYGNQTYTTPTTEGSSRVFILSRAFSNGSGLDVTVTNVGVFCYVAAMGNWVMIDKTNITFVVPNGGNKTVTYTLTVTV